MADLNKNGLASEGCQLMEEESERSVASVEEQLIKEMTVFEVFTFFLSDTEGRLKGLYQGFFVIY